MKILRNIFAAAVISCLLAACTENADMPATSSEAQEVSNVSQGEQTNVTDGSSESSLVSDIIVDISEDLSEETSEESQEPSAPEESDPEESSREEDSSVPSEESQEISTDTKPEQNKPHKVNGFIVDGDRAMEPFGGTSKGGGYTAEIFNLFKERVGSHVRVYAMPVPLACTFYAPEGYESSKRCMADCFYGLWDALTDIQFVDLITALQSHTEEDIYSKTDHHWTSLGAYYAAQALCREAGVDFATLDGFAEYSFDGFLGSAVTGFGVDELRKYPETFYWYEPLQAYTAHYYQQDYDFSFTGSIFSSANSYVKFIHGDKYVVRIETGVNNGRKLLLIKDSFGNALAPFLLAGFEEVYIVDYRYFECNVLTFIEENGITDVALSPAAFTVASSARNNITRLMDQ